MAKEIPLTERIGQTIKIKVKLRGKKTGILSGILKETKKVYGRDTIGLKMEGQSEIQWFNADKVVA